MASPTETTAAIHYIPDGFSLDRSDIKGRHAAGAGFLGGVARYPAMTPVHCYAASQAAAQHGANLLQHYAGEPRPVRWIPYGDLASLAEVGCLFQPDPTLGPLAWMRRNGDQRAFSLCGVTHTLCSSGALNSIAEYLAAPLQPWDALICTSQAARRAIEIHLGQLADYYAERNGCRPAMPVQLPVIPLGVDCGRFTSPRAAELRRELRQRHGIAADDTAVLFFGRLTFHAKAHPLAMLAAVELAGRRLGRPLHFLFTGRFPNDSIRDHFAAAAAAVAPATKVHFVPGEDDHLAEASWHGADLFLSLSDNIQETFGLTPIEAMAAGLPAVVSDWDGYKDTIVDGETGFRIPTLIPPAGAGEEMAMAHSSGQISYDRYIGAASLATAVDVPACAEAIVRLAGDAGRRAAMAEAARRRAREVYDWSAVLRRYGELWAELAAIRRSAKEIAPRRPGTAAQPPLDDPFRVFAGFASAVLADGDRLVCDDSCLPLETALALEMNTYMLSAFLPAAALKEMIGWLRRGPLAVSAVLAGQPRPQRVRLALMWLLKLGVARRLDG